MHVVQTLGSFNFGEPEVEVAVGEEVKFGFHDGGGCGNVRGSWNSSFWPFYCAELSGHSTKV